MKNQSLFSLKDKSETIKMSSAAIFVWCFKGLKNISAVVSSEFPIGSVD